MNLPTLRQLEYIVAVADLGHFGHAAARCAVSQPALSRQIQEAESLLGVTLFERTRPRTLVTPEAAPLIARARQLLTLARELAEAAASTGKEPAGDVALAAIPTVGPYLLPGMLARWRDELPQVRFIVSEQRTLPLLTALRTGQLDLGLLALPFEDEGLEVASLGFEPFVFVARDDHALLSLERLQALSLADEPLLLMEEGHCLGDQALDVCASAGAQARLDLRAASLGMLVCMVESGLGATLLPASALQREVTPSSRVVARRFAAPPPGRELALAWRISSPRGPLFRRLAAGLRAHLATLLGASVNSN